MDGPHTVIPPGVHLFPDEEEVFAERVSEHAGVLFPILSIDLSVIDPAWSGRVHMLLHNCDPYNAAVVPCFTAYCKDNSIGFDVVGGKYRFQTDLAYFDPTPDWQKWSAKTKELFLIAREQFQRTGGLPPRWDQDVPFLDQLGGVPRWVQEDETPLDPDGGPMRFIAQVSSWNYADDGCGRVLFLFYSHKHALAVIVDQCD